MAYPLRRAGVDHLLLLVDDIDAAIDFYETAIGCRLRKRMPQFGMAELKAGNDGIALVAFNTPEGAWAAEERNGDRTAHFALALETNNEDAVRDHLRACGAEVYEQRLDDGRLSLFTRDPSGNVVELRLLAHA